LKIKKKTNMEKEDVIKNTPLAEGTAFALPESP
jgi:hypothetical protein